MKLTCSPYKVSRGKVRPVVKEAVNISLKRNRLLSGGRQVGRRSEVSHAVVVLVAVSSIEPSTDKDDTGSESVECWKRANGMTEEENKNAV